jgi:hypothetical protein
LRFKHALTALQYVVGTGQEPPQTPAVQVAVPPVGVGQTWPQEPHLAVAVLRFTQTFPALQ